MIVMGVVNVTPDSFVAEVRTPGADAAVERALALAEAGARIVDVGGESTRPGAEPVGVDEELRRVVPVIEALAPLLPAGIEISIDTRSEAVARASVAAGATMVNDMSARLGPVAGELGVAYVAGHMQGTPATMQNAPSYDDVVVEVEAAVRAAADEAIAAGAPRAYVDPGIGFGKSIDHNLELLAHIDRFVAGPHPVLVGVSRKATVGHLHAASDRGIALGAGDPTPTADRLEASLALATWVAALGVRVVRAHDVAATVQALTVAEAVLDAGSGGDD